MHTYCDHCQNPQPRWSHSVDFVLHSIFVSFTFSLTAVYFRFRFFPVFSSIFVSFPFLFLYFRFSISFSFPFFNIFRPRIFLPHQIVPIYLNSQKSRVVASYLSKTIITAARCICDCDKLPHGLMIVCHFVTV